MRSIGLVKSLLLLGLSALASVDVSAGTAAAIPLQAADAGTYYVKASLAGQVETELLVDTGSGYVSLSEATFDRIKHAAGTIFQRQITGVLANGKSVSVPVYRIEQLDLGGTCILKNIEVAVFQNASRDILGLNALKLIQPITLQMEPPVMMASCS